MHSKQRLTTPDGVESLTKAKGLGRMNGVKGKESPHPGDDDGSTLSLAVDTAYQTMEEEVQEEVGIYSMMAASGSQLIFCFHSSWWCPESGRTRQGSQAYCKVGGDSGLQSSSLRLFMMHKDTCPQLEMRPSSWYCCFDIHGWTHFLSVFS